MAKARTRPPGRPPKLPPPTVRQCWGEFLKWVPGIPVSVAGASGLIWLAYRATASSGMVWKTESDFGSILFDLAFITLAYPVMLVLWALGLHDGVKAARDWQAMTPETQATAIVEAETAARPIRRERKAG